MSRLMRAVGQTSLTLAGRLKTARFLRWSVVIRTSMNLNHNPRLEYLQVADDSDLLAFYRQVCDAIFDEEPEGLGKTRAMPALEGMDDVPRQHGIKFGKQPRMGA